MNFCPRFRPGFAHGSSSELRWQFGKILRRIRPGIPGRDRNRKLLKTVTVHDDTTDLFQIREKLKRPSVKMKKDTRKNNNCYLSLIRQDRNKLRCNGPLPSVTQPSGSPCSLSFMKMHSFLRTVSSLDSRFLTTGYSKKFIYRPISVYDLSGKL